MKGEGPRNSGGPPCYGFSVEVESYSSTIVIETM
jgi:hypothetical protein